MSFEASTVRADTAALPSAAAQWLALLADTSLGAAPELPVYNDPASQAVAAAMADWPGIHEAMTSHRNAAADKFVAANNGTSQILPASDQSGANGIASVDGLSSSAGLKMA